MILDLSFVSNQAAGKILSLSIFCHGVYETKLGTHTHTQHPNFGA